MFSFGFSGRRSDRKQPAASAADARTGTDIGLLWPVIGLGVAVAITLFVGGPFAARQSDEATRLREQAVVANGFDNKLTEVGLSVVPQVVWDEAVSHLDTRFDIGWARDNIGAFFANTNGFAYSMVLDAEQKVAFAARTSLPTDAKEVAPFVQAMGSALATIRRDEAARLAGKLPGTNLSHPIGETTVAEVDGRLYIVSGALVQSDFGTAVSSARAPIVVIALEIERTFLEALAKRYMIEDLKLTMGPSTPSGASIPLKDSTGHVVAHLSWSPEKPGTALLKRAILPVTVVLAILAFVVTAFYRRAVTAAQSLVASEARASHLAYYDALTGLANRVMLFDRLGLALDQVRRGGGPIAVHCIDLDRLKEVNDTFGHNQGDELIAEASRRLAAVCRRSDTLARLSGDEFALVQHDATPEGAARLAARIVAAVAEPMELSAGKIFSGASVGVTLVSGGGMEPADALRQADLALYRAKQAGKSQFCFFEPEMDAALRMRRELESDLRQALADGGLHMVYQPQVDLKGAVIGVEALVRWRHPVRGDVAPAFFIPIAEECGLIGDIGLFTLRQAFEDSHRWRDLKVAVNVSASQLRLKSFVSDLAALLTATRADPRRFELEITEGILLGDDPVTHETLAKVRQMGFSIALDVFGTGYSSLGYLQRYPIDKIKIDRSFVANLGVETEADAVIHAIVKLARALKLSVIAEGVETVEQRERLAAVGCGEAQGYLYSRPIEAAEIDLYRQTAAASLAPPFTVERLRTGTERGRGLR